MAAGRMSFRRQAMAHRPATVSSVGVWVTDGMLLQAVEQFRRRIFASACRRISSHAGPLESRRRATKRHMTAVVPTSHPFPPIWQFDVGPSSLQWEPPTSREHRRQKKARVGVSGLISNLVSWLESTVSIDQPPISRPVAWSESGLVSSEALAVNPAVGAAPLTETSLRAAPAASLLPEEINALRASIRDLDGLNFAKLSRLTDACRRSLRCRIKRGDMSAAALRAALEPLDCAARSRIQPVTIADKMSAMIRRSILSAMAEVSKGDPAAVPDELWLAFVDRICASNADHHHIQLFWRLADCIPASLRDKICVDQIHNLTSAFISAQASRHNLFGHWSARAARFSQAIGKFSSQQREALNGAVMDILLRQQDWQSEKARRMRFSWLIIKAYDAHVSREELVRLYRRVCVGGVDSRLNRLQRWQVLVARLSAIGVLDTKARKLVLEASQSASIMAERWSTLVTQIMASQDRRAGLRELCALLSEVGELTPTIRSLASSPVDRMRQDTTEALAVACDDHNLALQLYDLNSSKPQSHLRQPVWTWSVWTKYAEEMIKDAALDPTRIWQVLKLSRATAEVNKLAKEEEIRAKTHLLDQMGQWFVEAPHLSDRQVLRNVQRCINQQRALTNGISSRMLASVVQVVSRDLERGHKGRTSRMRWALGLVARNHGARHARDVAAAWRGWRWTIEQSRCRDASQEPPLS